jgi:glucan phosphoethanolaminetransferase (alkaline phosphatase superfamily)
MRLRRTQGAAKPRDILAAMTRPARAYLFALAAIWILQTVVRLVLFRVSGMPTGLIAGILHASFLLSLLCLLALALSALAALSRFETLRALAVALSLGAFHAVLTAFDIFQAIFINVTGAPGPALLIFQNRMLSLSLLDNIGISPRMLLTGMLALVAAHVLAYVPIARALLRLLAGIGATRWRLAGIRLTGRSGLAAAGAGLFAAASAVPLESRAGEPVLEGLRAVFQIAPPALLAAARTPPPPPSRPGRPAPPTSRPLVLIVVDALRRDRMGIYEPDLANTPFLTSLEARGKLRKYDAYATCTFSFCGIMSIMASQSWNGFAGRPDTLVGRLLDNSYQVHLMLAGQYATFGGLLNVLGGPVTSISEQPSAEQPDDNAVLGALEKLQIQDPDRTFLYLHLVSTHAGTFVEPPFRTTPDDIGKLGAYLFSPGAKGEYRTIYDLRVRQADEMIRRSFSLLERKGVLKDALVIITSDHGQRTAEGGLLYHGGEADPPTLNIPLLIYDGRGIEYPPRTLASQIDVAPTFARSIGIELAAGWKGVPLQEATRREAVPVGTSQSSGIVVQQDGLPLLYLCRRNTGKESVVPLSRARPGRDARAGAHARLLQRMRALHRTVAAPLRDPACRK